MPRPVILGICRFSYLGQSDFAAFRGRPERTEEFLAGVAADLYADNRMAARFHAFETICLPSVLAQRQPGFVFLVVTSTRMPAPWLNRLRGLCDGHDEIQLLVTDETDLSDALRPTLLELHKASDGDLVQFRLDDDDALAVDYILRLRGLARRMAGIDQYAISFARGLNVALYPGQAMALLEMNLPFLGGGLAMRMANPQQSLFTRPHFRAGQQMTSLIAHDAPATLLLRWPSDSRALDLNQLPPYLTRLDPAAFDASLNRHFPFLAGIDFDGLRPAHWA
ncbi:MAG: glycosyltransferase [Paracoccus sp. (in: a-proteobacteria)]|uniref:glycosyltransferase n=1 Tax=Paracoccus sp. TaxID=267 RepID=UPI0026E06277|nr:glycosyltransferase [Paracoccus sp. (in: a-proteobacteria)]MDO5632718.1 glycosyltransferase [Paracoccus sp. (in: a-proteobacteria)]